jgi:hypothetical protein
VTFSEVDPDATDLLPVHHPAHSARVDEFRARGELLMVGTFANPIEEGDGGVPHVKRRSSSPATRSSKMARSAAGTCASGTRS